jgi:hypothetical protein
LDALEQIHTLDDRHDSALLDSRGALETISVDTCLLSASVQLATEDFLSTGLTAKQLGLEVHGIEGVGDLVIVRLDLSCKRK